MLKIIVNILFFTVFFLSNAIANDEIGKGKIIRPVVSILTEELFQHRILFRALEELGYKVAEPISTDYKGIHNVLGNGDADFTAVHWSSLHHKYYKDAGGDKKLQKLGIFINNVLQGYMVDKKTYDLGVQNLADLKDPKIAALFDTNGDGKADLTGCSDGWACKNLIEHHLKEYGLNDTVIQKTGKYSDMINQTIFLHNLGRPVLYYAWIPHWVSGTLYPRDDSMWLSVPYTSFPDGLEVDTTYHGKNLGFAIDKIRIVARKDFLEDNPAVKRLFRLAKINIAHISVQNKKIRDGENKSADIDRHVEDWIKNNQRRYQHWLKEARKVVQKN